MSKEFYDCISEWADRCRELEHALAEKDAQLESYARVLEWCNEELLARQKLIDQQVRELERLKQEREDCWLRFAATGTHEDFLVSLDTCLLSEFEQGEKLKAIALQQAKDTQ